MSTAAQWLALREPFDRRARNPAVLEAVTSTFVGRPSMCIADLGCGIGSTLRVLGPYIGAPQTWRLCDNDVSVLARAADEPNATALQLDLMSELEAAIADPLDLITISALLDLVSGEWLKRLVVEVAARRVPVYAALTYDGRIEFTPSDPLDATIVAAVNTHQRRDKGFGPALGPQAARVAAAEFQRVGYVVTEGPSDWAFSPHDREIQKATLEDWAGATREVGTVAPDDLAGWLERRTENVERGVSSMCVGNVDLFARPASLEV
jgi:SAM-dependent methyltransferase